MVNFQIQVVLTVDLHFWECNLRPIIVGNFLPRYGSFLHPWIGSR